jgi:hypothetical protein
MANVTATVATGKQVVVGDGAGATTYTATQTVTLPSREKAVLVSQGIVS